MQAAAGLIRREWNGMCEDDVAGVQFAHDVQRGDAGFGIAGIDRRLDAGRAAVFGQQRGMQVDDGGGGQFENVAAQDLPVGHDHDDVR